MKGIILAGGLGTRLHPLTKITNKHLLPVFDRPMVYYPIQALINIGIRDILLVTGGPRAGDFLRLLGNGREFGLKHIDYTFQDAILYPWGAFPMPANLPHRDAANALIDWMSAPQMQAAVAKQLLLGPNVSEAFKSLTKAELAKTPNAPENRAKSYTIKTQQAAKQDADYATKYADWVAS